MRRWMSLALCRWCERLASCQQAGRGVQCTAARLVHEGLPVATKSASADAIRVLVIDDLPSYAETIAETLARVGYDCTIATSGTEGARLIESEEWDVILTDLKMADLDGLAILRKAKEELPDAEVVVITGFGDVKTAVEAIKQGAANYLTKPEIGRA